jgi:hypothetical protein
LTAEDIDERISRAVEAEVARRMAEKEKEWEAEKKEAAAEAERSMSKSPDTSLPAGVLTPILRKHRDLDDELKMRLQELEKKLSVPRSRNGFPSLVTDYALVASKGIRKHSLRTFFLLFPRRRLDVRMSHSLVHTPRSTPVALSSSRRHLTLTFH